MPEKIADHSDFPPHAQEDLNTAVDNSGETHISDLMEQTAKAAAAGNPDAIPTDPQIDSLLGSKRSGSKKIRHKRS